MKCKDNPDTLAEAFSTLVGIAVIVAAAVALTWAAVDTWWLE
jgi:hypothetical protein